MPYPNEHSARLQEPNRFNPKTFRRKKDGTIYGRIKVPSTIAVIWGKLKEHDKAADQPIPQALRFPTKSWTVEQAKKWLKDNKVKHIRFEPARKEKDKGGSDDLQPMVASMPAGVGSVLAQLQTEQWVMEAHALEQLMICVANQQTILPADIRIQDEPTKLQISNKTAIIPIKGILMRQIPTMFRWWGIEATSYITIQQQVALALANPGVKDIVLDVDSPGGIVSGVQETADMIRQANKHKAVTSIIDDEGNSGAYWLVSQGGRIEAVRNGMVGSIGVFCVYMDQSARAKELGIKVHVIRSGEHKGMGVPGAEISDGQIAAVQQVIDGIADHFVTSVAAGRNRPKDEVRAWATGQYWLAPKAAQMGVIDKVMANQTKLTVNKGKVWMRNRMITNLRPWTWKLRKIRRAQRP